MTAYLTFDGPAFTYVPARGEVQPGLHKKYRLTICTTEVESEVLRMIRPTYLIGNSVVTIDAEEAEDVTGDWEDVTTLHVQWAMVPEFNQIAAEYIEFNEIHLADTLRWLILDEKLAPHEFNNLFTFVDSQEDIIQPHHN